VPANQSGQQLQFVRDASFDAPGSHAYVSWLQHQAGSRPFGTIVVRGGQTGIEHFGGGATPQSTWEIGSLRKAVGSTLLGMAIDERRLSLDTKAVDICPELFSGPDTSKDSAITVRQLFCSTSGWKRPEHPGVVWFYNNAAFTAGGMVVGRVYQQPDDSLANLVRERIADVLNCPSWKCSHFPGAFSRNYGEPGPKLAIESNLADLTRFGEFWLQKGRWRGRQHLPRDYVEMATSNQADAAGGHYGLGWFVNNRQQLLPDAPADTFFHIGNGKNDRRTVLAIVPSLDLVAVVGVNAEAFDITAGYTNVPVVTVNDWLRRIVECCSKSETDSDPGLAGQDSLPRNIRE
jgi:CubicO group peptidase (beta-lactamase class C family)